MVKLRAKQTLFGDYGKVEKGDVFEVKNPGHFLDLDLAELVADEPAQKEDKTDAKTKEEKSAGKTKEDKPEPKKKEW